MLKNQIKAVFFDLDDTLLDFNLCARDAIIDSCKDMGIEFSETLYENFTRINPALWKMVETGVISRATLHKLRFLSILSETGIDADDQELERLLKVHIKKCAVPLPYAKEILQYLQNKYELYVTSNASQEQQVLRLEKAGLLPYLTDVFTSGRIGVEKPKREFFEGVFSHLSHLSPEQTIIVGDSLRADIVGGKAYGIKTCWLDRFGNDFPGVTPDYTITKLEELENLL
jgi:YjjG family noncanonical pyrimidine nucleotidase